MSNPNLLGMDPLTFTLTMFSVCGVLFSAVNFLRHFTPTNLYLHAADLVTETRNLYDMLEQENTLPADRKKLAQFQVHLEFLEDRLKSFMFVIVSTNNICRILQAWFKIWDLLRLSREVEIFRVGIMSLSDHRKRINRAMDLAQREGVTADLTELEADAEATTEMLISTLGVRDYENEQRDVELNAGRRPTVDATNAIHNGRQPTPTGTSSCQHERNDEESKIPVVPDCRCSYGDSDSETLCSVDSLQPNDKRSETGQCFPEHPFECSVSTAQSVATPRIHFTSPDFPVKFYLTRDRYKQSC